MNRSPKDVLFGWELLASCGQKKSDHPNRRKVALWCIEQDIKEWGDAVHVYVQENPQWKDTWEWANDPGLYFYWHVFFKPREDREMLVALWDYLGR